MTESSDANFVSSYFDCTHLETLRILSMSGAPFDVGEVVDLFLSSSASDLVELKSSLAAGDREQIRQTTHRLKGACSQIGAIRIRKAVEEGGVRNWKLLYRRRTAPTLTRKSMNLLQSSTASADCLDPPSFKVRSPRVLPACAANREPL